MHFVIFLHFTVIHLQHVICETFILNAYKKTITYKGCKGLNNYFKIVKDNFMTYK